MKKQMHYRYIIGILCFITIFVAVGLTSTSFSVVSPYLTESWRITNIQFGILTSIRTLTSVVSMLGCVFYYRKLSYKIGLTLALLSGAFGFVVLAFGTCFEHGVVAMTFLGISYGFAGMIPISVLIGNWFLRYRSLMLGICSAATGLATFMVSGIVPVIISLSSLSVCLLFYGLVTLIVAILNLIFCVDRAEKIGVKSLSIEEQEVQSGVKKKEGKKYLSHRYQAGMTEKCTMFLVSFLLGGVCYTPTALHGLNLATSGWTPEKSASVISYFGLFLILGKIIYGRVSDLVPQKKCSIIWYLALFICNILFSMSSSSFFDFSVALTAFFIQGIGGPLATTGLSVFAIDMTDEQSYGKWVGYYNVAYNIGAMIFTPVAGLIADLTGTYGLAFIGCAVLSVVCLVLTQIAYAGAEKRT